MTPTGTRVFVIPTIEEKVGLIHLARMSRQMPDRGVIAAIAPKAKAVLGVDVGDTVIFDKHYQQLSDDGKRTMVEAKYVLALLSNAELSESARSNQKP